jgi:hypothetical protein
MSDTGWYSNVKARHTGNGSGGDGSQFGWAEPDMEVLRLHRRPPPPLPLSVFGPWQGWIQDAADAAACPPDYVVAPLLSAASVLIGHSRWAQATAGWAEPPHLWTASVGESGNGKSPGADALMRHVLPEIEQRMTADFPDRLQEWRAEAAFAKAAQDRWQQEVRVAEKKGTPPPTPPAAAPPEPQSPRLRQNDATIERVATLLATAAPKGLLVVRDELPGWISGMNAYNDGGRAFWIEAYGGRPYRIERQKYPEPIIVPRLAVGVFGTVQPDRLRALMHDADDGLLARILWAWPENVAFRLGRRVPRTDWAIECLDRLRWLDLQRDPLQPLIVPLAAPAVPLIEKFGREAQVRQSEAGGLMSSALGNARGQALRLSLVLELLWWCAEDGAAPPPIAISEHAFAQAAILVGEYFLPMAERVYGDAAVGRKHRNASTLARWILREKATEVHVRDIQRKRLSGLSSAELIHDAAGVLVDADWLRSPPGQEAFGPRPRLAYPVNPRVWEVER